MPRDNRCVYMTHVCFNVCCSDCVGVWGNVCCVAYVVEDVFLRHSLQAVELSQRTQAAVQIVSNLPVPSNGARFTVFWHAGHADPLDGWQD